MLWPLVSMFRITWMKNIDWSASWKVRAPCSGTRRQTAAMFKSSFLRFSSPAEPACFSARAA